MKKIFILVIFLFLSGCSAMSGQPSTNLSIFFQVDKTIEVGDIIILETNIESLTVEGTLSWQSSDELLATVDNGMVTALAPGNVTITAAVDSYEDVLRIEIIEKTVKPQIEIIGNQTIEVGQTTTLQALVHDSEDAVVWASNLHTIATVSAGGVVSGLAIGIASITAYLESDDTVYATYLVYVKGIGGSSDVTINETVHESYELSGTYDLSALNTTITDLVSNVKDSVIGVSNYQYNLGVLDLTSLGSGVIYSKTVSGSNFTYRALTNHHVIEDNDAVKAYFGYLDREVSAYVVKSDADLDLAVIQFTTNIDVDAIPFGQITQIHLGDFVIAIGNPTGYEYFGSVTMGIISGLQREMSATTALFIQHDAAINPGNSGGPLFNMNGQIIGINTLKISSTDVDNMGFAISITTIRDYLGI